MAVVKSGNSTDQWTIDPVSNAGRVTLYKIDGTPFNNNEVVVVIPSTQIWKQIEPSTTQAGVNFWTPASGKMIAVTSIDILTGANITLTIWFGALGDATFNQGADQPLFRGGVVNGGIYPLQFPTPRTGPIDFSLKITTSGNGQVYVTVYGYEI